MKIRLMTPDDYDSLYALWLSTAGMGLNSADDSREGITKYLLRNPVTCFVAEENGELLGAILSGHDGRRGYISHTAVAEKHRRRGIGAALVDAVLSAMKAEGINKIALVVFARNELGNAFWEKRGFTVRDDLKAIPHKDCRSIAPSDFSSDCTDLTQTGWRLSRKSCTI